MMDREIELFIRDFFKEVREDNAAILQARDYRPRPAM